MGFVLKPVFAVGRLVKKLAIVGVVATVATVAVVLLDAIFGVEESGRA